MQINCPDLENNSTCWDFKHNAKGGKMKLKIQSIKNYFKSKKDRGLEPIFFEKIGDKKTSRDEMLKNLIQALEKNCWTIKKQLLVHWWSTDKVFL